MISINIIHGAAFVTDDDRDRAKAAAMAVLTAAGVEPAAAAAEFRRQWEAAEDQDYENLTGLAVIWVAAEKAADVALTEGWARPDGASCGISA